MALYISRHNTADKEEIWYIGNNRPRSGEDVKDIQADGDELAYIDRNFVGIPGVTNGKRVVTWRGEFARFIVDNLPGRSSHD